MNTRIRELAVKAGAVFSKNHEVALLGDEIEKFAESIIKETIQVARAGIEFGDNMEYAVYRYFGVKE